MNQRVLPLAGKLALDVEAKRRWVLGHYESDPVASYSTVKAKLALLDTILSNGWVEQGETVKLQALGVAFGDALAQELGLAWVAVDDEHGCDPALILEGTSLTVFPLTSISKHVEAGDSVDIYELFAVACSTIRRVSNDS